MPREMVMSFDSLDLPVSYKALDPKKLYDAKNVFSKDRVLETRYAIQRLNTTTLGGAVLSISFFQDGSGNRYLIAKVGSILYKVTSSGGVSIKTGLSTTTKHRAVTINGRHIIFIEDDGIFAYDGTTFTVLGETPPTEPSATNTSTGHSLTAGSYQVALTYYSSTLGYETNIGTATSTITVASGEKIAVSSIPTGRTNEFIDKKRLYLKDVGNDGDWILWAELDYATTSDDIDSDPLSSVTPPEKNAKPLSGGGKYACSFGKCLAYTGNSNFPSDVFISEEYLPDAYDDTTTAKTLNIDGNGPNTGIASAYYSNSKQVPYLVIFKKTSITIFNNTDGQVLLDDTVGCVSHDTISVRDGIVYFMSNMGWLAIKDGRLFRKGDGKAYTLSDGDIDDIFSREGWTYQLNSSQYSNFFSTYYSTLGQYLTFIAEGSNTSFSKAYTYEDRLGGFRPFEFKTAFKCACTGEDSVGDEVVFIGDDSGIVFTYSIKNGRTDENADGTDENIDAFVILSHLVPKNHFNTCNWRELTTRAFANDNAVSVRAFRNYDVSDFGIQDYDFSSESGGFILDLSKLDEGTFGNERVPIQKTVDLNVTARSILVGFYQNAAEGNMGLISTQLKYTQNGNNNL